MEVDHFNPHVEGRKRNKYSNLMLATRTCNGMKLQVWPTSAERRKGIRFLNCTKEDEFLDGHIVENFETHELEGLTPAGIYHIENLDLNAPIFIEERRRRWEVHQILNKTSIKVTSQLEDHQALLDTIGALRQEYEKMIPLPPESARKIPPTGTSSPTTWVIEKPFGEEPAKERPAFPPMI